MPKPGKAIKRSARAVERLTKNTSKRADEAQMALAAGTYDADQFATHAAGQALDTLQAWLALFGVSDARPEAFVDLLITGSGSATVMQSATVVLEEPVANVALLNPTDLVAPGSTIPKAGVVVTQVGTDPEVEIISVAVTVPNNQTEALYRGFITDGAAVLVDVIANVHT